MAKKRKREHWSLLVLDLLAPQFARWLRKLQRTIDKIRKP